MTASDEFAAQPARGGFFGSRRGRRVVAVVNSKGGVGKTTLASNLAVYAQTVDAKLPVLVLGLDDSSAPDDMFALDEASPKETTYTALYRGCFDTAIRRGLYGVHYVPSGPRTAASMHPGLDRFVLRRALGRTAFPGLVIIDTHSDLGMWTQNAIAASDLTVVPVADIPSLFTAKDVFELLAAWGQPRSRARLVLSMLDLRIKYGAELCCDLLGLLVTSARRLDLPFFQSFISRSPRVQALATNPEGRVYSILHEASRTNVHDQMGELAQELLETLERAGATTPDGIGDPSSKTSPEVGTEPFVILRPRTREAAFAVPFDAERPLCVREFPFFMGRDDPGVLNDLAIQDLQPWQVSRRHAHLIRRDGRIGVMDLGSRLGTWVDDRQLGGPTADPGPAYFGPTGGELVLGKRRRSPYVFEVEVSRSRVSPSMRDTAPLPSWRTAALAALVH
jgi:cellulose biosynthesis protein BcsQ